MKAASQPASSAPIFYPSLVAAALLPMLVLDQVRLVGSLSATLDAAVSGVLATAGAVGAVLIMLAVCERVVRRAGERCPMGHRIMRGVLCRCAAGWQPPP